MIDISKIDYSLLDRPEILMYLFHPRPEFGRSISVSDNTEIMIPVEAEIAVGARFHLTDKSACNILFFHGNGEIVSDYDEFGQMMNQLGINFLAVDYRGYGRSTGQPTVTAMMRDSHIIFDYVKKWLNRNDYPGPVVLMGRSLGSASVLELALHYAAGIDGLIVESGFAYAGPLLVLLGINPAEIGFEEAKGFRNIDKISTFQKPTLIIR
ncbi:MAG: alpha/beta fold hydrolase, partial [Desulfobacterales bacterium]|nr:alpha/beta fold hydrolase [Desulfobacterales bacterium]